MKVKLVLLFCLLLVWVPAFAEPETTPEVETTPESVKSSPWFDGERNTYKEYSKEDLAPYLKKRKVDRPSGFMLPDLSVVVYLAIIAAVCAALYMLIKNLRDRKSAPDRRRLSAESTVPSAARS